VSVEKKAKGLRDIRVDSAAVPRYQSRIFEFVTFFFKIIEAKRPF
jgi:hypothetical protein